MAEVEGEPVLYCIANWMRSMLPGPVAEKRLRLPPEFTL
jgi:hypothetical protein